MKYLEVALKVISTLCLIVIAIKASEYEPPMTYGKYNEAAAAGTSIEAAKKIPLVKIK